MTQLIKKLYMKSYIRFPLKVLIWFTANKISIDFFNYMNLNHTFGLTRQMAIYDGVNQVSPPFAAPYPYADTYEHLQKIKEYCEWERRVVRTAIFYSSMRQMYLYMDHPLRENPDCIDRLMQYGNIYRVKEMVNYTFINKLKNEGISIPEGINQSIRSLSQYKLDFHRPIVPQL